MIDLTMQIDGRTPSFPGSPKQEIVQISTIKEKGWNEKKLSFSSHFSTHIDAPFHMLEDGKKLTDFPISKFIGEAIVLDARKPNFNNIKQGDIVFFNCGHTKDALSLDFFKTNPGALNKETADKLAEKRISIFGVDSFSPDNEPDDTIHKIFFRKEILIVENLVNLDKLKNKRFKCYILPLNIKDADGAPCRVIGEID